MSGFFSNMGFIQWPMYVATVFMAVQIARAALETRKPVVSRSPMTRHTILIWGVLNALLGVLGTALGLTLAGESIQHAGSLSAPVLAGGIKIALSSTVFGLLLLTVAIVAWLVLQAVQGGRTAGAEAGSGAA